MLGRFCCGLVVVLVLPAFLSARQDVRLSPPESTSYVVPPDIRIQSADQVGATTLVVWGTTVFASDSSVVNELQMQMLRDTSIVGEPKSLHSSAARPSGFVQVVPSGSMYLVFWNDNRLGAPGIYLQRVDTNGQRIGDEEMLSIGKVARDVIRVIGDPDKGRLFVWLDDKRDMPGIYVRHINAIEVFDDVPQRIASGLFGTISFPSIPDATLLVFSYHSMLVRNDGTVDPRPINLIPSRDPYYLRADTSLVCLRGSTLYWYPSVFDTISHRSLYVPALDSGIAATRVVTQDSLGREQVIFTTLRISGGAGYQDYGELRITAYAVTVLDDTTVSEPKQIYVHSSPNSSAGEATFSVVSFKSVSRAQGSANTSLILLELESVHYIHGHSQDPSKWIFDFSLGTGGNYVRGSSEFIPIVGSKMVLPVARTSWDTLSSVTITVQQRAHNLSTTTAYYLSKIPQAGPSIFVRNGNLLSTWYQAGPGHFFSLNQWLPGSTKYVHELGRQVPQRLPQPSSIGQGRPGETAFEALYYRSDFYYPTGGYSAMLSNEFQIISGSYWLTQATKTSYSSFVSDWGFYIATDAGWNRAAGSHIVTPSDYGYDGFLTSFYGFNPNREELLVFARLKNPGPLKNYTLYAVSASGAIAWSITNPIALDGATVLAIDSMAYLSIKGDSVTRVRDRAVTGTFKFPSSRPDAVYQRLLGPYFLRRYATDSIGLSLQLELYSVDGTLHAERVVSFDAPSVDRTIIQNPSDSSLWILFARDGVRSTHLDKMLMVLSEDEAISATRDSVRNPVGAFRNDTLFAVWEDYRNGNADIYSAQYKTIPLRVKDDYEKDTIKVIATHGRDTITVKHWQNSHSTATPSDVVSHISITSIMPNPAFGSTNVEFFLSVPDEVVVQLYDELGRAVEQQMLGAFPAGKYLWNINTERFANGMYTVVVRTSTRQTTGRVLLFH